jgi:uncharacterized protein (DUF1015 family)
MASIQQFRALRPAPASAARVAAVPYDVVSVEEAKALSDGNPLSFLHVSRPEKDLPGVDPYADRVYRAAADRFQRLKREAPFEVEDRPSLYLYRLRMGDHEQTGVAAAFSLDDYEGDVILKHERTRRDKEDDRTRHMLALGAQTGPVFLVYRADPSIDRIAARVTQEAPLYDFSAVDDVRHTIWRVSEADTAGLVQAFSSVRRLYIADGHHRAASAARARRELAKADRRSDDAETFLAVAFPHDQTEILPYNRIVKELNGLDEAGFMEEVQKRFVVSPGRPQPAGKGEISMYVGGRWHTLGVRAKERGVIDSLDVSVLQDELLAPVLGIADVRTDKRIDFVGGVKGPSELERQVDSGRAAVAFSLFPVSIDDLMRVSDDGGIMPPKSTWFEPKLRDGLLIHTI